jgi:endonuclease III related protein
MKARSKATGQSESSGNIQRHHNLIPTVYKRLLSFHGPQGWWPIVNTGAGTGEYHVKSPRSEADFFEIAIGAILTQNISWKNVDTSLAVLKKNDLLAPGKLMMMSGTRLAGLIKSTGYYNQKAKKIKNFLRWYRTYNYNWQLLKRKNPTALRDELLSINGIGPETADSILLYALGKKIFVVDAYTTRIFTRMGVLSGTEKYNEIQDLFHRRFCGRAIEYNEYHALIVAHGKDYCKKKPSCRKCCLIRYCRWNRLQGEDIKILD